MKGTSLTDIEMDYFCHELIRKVLYCEKMPGKRVFINMIKTPGTRPRVIIYLAKSTRKKILRLLPAAHQNKAGELALRLYPTVAIKLRDKRGEKDGISAETLWQWIEEAASSSRVCIQKTNYPHIIQMHLPNNKETLIPVLFFALDTDLYLQLKSIYLKHISRI